MATARAFLARELGMTDMVAGPFRSTGARAGEVDFRHKYGEGRRLPQTGDYAVVVRLQRLPAGWWVLGVQSRSIQITSPTRLQRINSPLTVHGKAEVYEGSLLQGHPGPAWPRPGARPGPGRRQRQHPAQRPRHPPLPPAHRHRPWLGDLLRREFRR